MKKITYKSFIIETVNEGTINERSIAMEKGVPVFASQSDMNKSNSLEKVKAKIDLKK